MITFKWEWQKPMSCKLGISPCSACHNNYYYQALKYMYLSTRQNRAYK